MLMPKVSDACKHHRKAETVRGIDDFLITNGATRLQDRQDPRARRFLYIVDHREEPVTRQAPPKGPLPCFANRKAHRLHPAHLAGADSDGAASLGDDDCIRQKLLGHLRCKKKRPELPGSRPSLRDGPKSLFGKGLLIRRLNQKPTFDPTEIP